MKNKLYCVVQFPPRERRESPYGLAEADARHEIEGVKERGRRYAEGAILDADAERGSRGGGRRGRVHRCRFTRAGTRTAAAAAAAMVEMIVRGCGGGRGQRGNKLVHSDHDDRRGCRRRRRGHSGSGRGRLGGRCHRCQSRLECGEHGGVQFMKQRRKRLRVQGHGVMRIEYGNNMPIPGR